MAHLDDIGPRGLPIAYRVRDVRIAPNVVLAPMEGVTDLTFRRLVRAIGGAGMTCTEFVASNALRRGDGRMREMASFDPDESPVSVQLYGREPAAMADAARIVQDMGATFCDINMGCPSKKVCANSGGSALMREPGLATEIVRAVRRAVDLPLTVKMRSGFDAGDRNAAELAWMCQEEGAEAVTIHWRTRADGYSGERAVDRIAEAVQRLVIPVVGNGDVVDPASAEAMLRDTGCAGVMVGRGAMKNPWSLLQIGQWLRGEPLTVVDRREKHRVLTGFLDALEDRFETERGALGRFKAVARYFLEADGEDLRRAVLRAQTIAEAVTLLDELLHDPRAA